MSDKTFNVDISVWRMGDYADFFAAGNKNDFLGQFELIAKVIKSWPYAEAGDPSTAEAYRNLSVTEWQECLSKVGEAIAAQFQRGN